MNLLKRAGVLTAAVALCWPASAVAAQPSAPAASTAAADVQLCPAKDPLERPVYSPVGSSAAKFVECNKGVPVVLDCPKGLLFNPRLNVCDWPWRARTLNIPTTTQTMNTAEGIAARVTWEGKPLYDAAVTFSAPDGKRVCDAYTDDEGLAVCPGTDSPAGGYTAAYAGSETMLASSALSAPTAS
ncbi:carbohydrate-binding module family 14 protein [Streptomyces californicus]|uniref:carbohydrate-binding module family 14 protein n=1 Tax=Streptomyces californicus TaxID=67351 RepID=UPI003714112F